MRKINKLALAAIIASALLITSCREEQFDNPVTEPEQTSAEDPGRWWIDESYMDKSVNPGDNFYMYCIGTWWKTTPLTEDVNFVDYFTYLKPTFQERVNSLTDANYQKFLSDLKWADDGSEAAIAGQWLYDDVLAKSGLEAATTKEEVLRALGRMSAMGVSPAAWIEPFFMDGKVCLHARYNVPQEMVDPVDESSPGNAAQKEPSLLQMMNDAPSLQSHLVPLVGRGGTRAVPDDCLPLRYIVEGMGLDPKDIYFLEYYKSQEPSMERCERLAKGDIAKFNDHFSLDFSVEELKKRVLEYYDIDYPFISQKTRAAYDAKLAKESADNDIGVLFKASLETVKSIMDSEYSPYLRAKGLADQMMPQGVKEDYLNYCEELRATFAKRIKDNAWMSEGTKQNALEKLDAMVFNVGYPDKWISEGLPDFSTTKSLLEDIYSFRKARVNILKAIVGKSRQEAAFTVILMDKENPLSSEEAYYQRYLNAFTIFPYYILPPFYDPTQSLAINYAFLGSTIGHEMTHGFDTIGSQYDKNGDYLEGGIWASEADKAEFNRRTEQLVECYASYDILPDEMPGVKAEGKITVAENIADLGGMEMGYQAYLNRLRADGYTGDNLKLMKQRFFLAYTEGYRAKYGVGHVKFAVFGEDSRYGPDVHSMNKERVNGVVANMDGWYDAFDITGGALYRAPADRIKIW